ncbi:uncharacterized protein TRIVIDRAFT_71064 [Trichoderma virens Gv29-8]|uniref:ASST-domain-containing protein n=1 Tax=Hypocrea virens (strain Gv29-8 / FGSC 10586) TaxID=413071 RepID=G9MU06_HYPVG|nr:uncharacterized protein TRIVIDRAFT_71064 [Trichoderma virens Gv29-8]EHK22076.1 hypothetical protein TRIVIDRAFT_71064 [Trichoderma virens Gv29-8]UKZ57132.1 hypothetical protein TrVGV298_010984 [Trichoderma virens]
MTFSILNLLGGLTLAAASMLPQSWPSVSYKTEPFTSPLLNVTRTGPTAPGLIWFSPAVFFPQQGGPPTSELSPFLVTQEGEVVFHGPNYPASQPDFFANFRPQMFSNGTILSYYLGQFGPSMEQALGNVTFLDSNLMVTNTICLADYPSYIPGGKDYPCKVDLHESRRLSNDRFLVTTHNFTQTDLSAVGGPKDGWVTDSQFLVINPYTEEIYFKWSSLDHLDKLPYFHINSVDEFENGYVISARHFSSVVFIDEHGEVTYRLGGVDGQDFKLDPAATFGYQHDVHARRETDGSIMVTMYDDENYDVPPISEDKRSSALSVRLDTKDMTAKLDRRLFSNDTVQAIGLGSWQDQPNGHVFVGDATFPSMSEFDENNKEVWNMRYGFTGPGSFRAYKFTDWKSTPSYPPKVFAESLQDGSAVVHMSWNGATEVASWRVLAVVGSNATFVDVGTVKKSGFETSYTVNREGVKEVMVMALDADGKHLSTSVAFSL